MSGFSETMVGIDRIGCAALLRGFSGTTNHPPGLSPFVVFRLWMQYALVIFMQARLYPIRMRDGLQMPSTLNSTKFRHDSEEMAGKSNWTRRGQTLGVDRFCLNSWQARRKHEEEA
ncbi:hypothetical protein K469DRAFT_34309 [Zopfia rhizophila CBS 207.26]|uniref:Uncharacterized protein n=1 Tax=Zopfia rhizophila CBS 207.26 TaxID=1314779 RepID=A0A6A6DFE0_9PEZI|nr:hypothetical protein K469DRAFT_34309 [Zopfia rhizophila CBS 207.26]